MSEKPELVVVKGGLKENESNLTPSQRRGKRLYEWLASINNISDAAFYNLMQSCDDWKRDHATECPACGKIILPNEKYADDGTCSLFCHNQMKQKDE